MKNFGKWLKGLPFYVQAIVIVVCIIVMLLILSWGWSKLKGLFKSAFTAIDYGLAVPDPTPLDMANANKIQQCANTFFGLSEDEECIINVVLQYPNNAAYKVLAKAYNNQFGELLDDRLRYWLQEAQFAQIAHIVNG